jgi:pimeloyl-ACP methyl ester carboxylesterase
MAYAVLNGCRMFYEVAGDGPPVLFLHGGFGGLGTGGPRETPRVPGFARHHTVITYDRRSTGRSDSTDGRHSLTMLAADAAALLDHLGESSAVIWGQSAGVAIAITFALERPERADALILGDGAPWFSHDAGLVQHLKERINLLDTAGPEAAYDARRTVGTVGLKLFAADRPARSEEEERQRAAQREVFRDALKNVSRDDRIRAYARELWTYAAYVDFDATDHMSEITVPTLILYGTADTVFPKVDWISVAAAMPNATYVPLEGGEHGSATTRQDGLDRIGKFLADLPRS